MKTILYQMDNDKILVNELLIDKEQFIRYNENKIKQLYIEDLKNITSDLIYNVDKDYYGEKNKYNLKKYHKIYSDFDGYNDGNVTYLIPKINKQSTSIYNKFSNKSNVDLKKYHLENLPKFEDIKDYYKNHDDTNELFYFPTSYQALKLKDELKLLYKILYIKNFDIDKNEIINIDEFKKIFSLNFKEVLSYDTYFDILSKYNSNINYHVIRTINNDINKDEEKIKKLKLILK